MLFNVGDIVMDIVGEIVLEDCATFGHNVPEPRRANTASDS